MHTWHASSRTLREYAAGSLGDAVSWSVEMHLPACSDCRARLAGLLTDADRMELARLRDGLQPARRPVRRPVSRSTALRGVLGPWWAWASLVVSAFAAMTFLGQLPIPPSVSLSSWAVALAPLVPLSMVATVYALADSDPAAAATPRGGLELALIRTIVVLAIAIPTVTAGMVTAGIGTAAWLLPGLALCAGALALGPVAGMERACVGLAILWGTVVLAAAPPSELAAAATLIQPAGHVQALWAVALLAAGGVVVARRDRFDIPGRLS
jgi:hypothetical protein